MPIVIANKGFGGKATFTNKGGGGVFRMKYNILPYLLDTYSGASAAYSLRKLRTAYSGAAIRVRRDSDSTTTDIGFTSSGALDETALLAFVGAGSGYVTIWYDQSGNGKNTIQNTVQAQPRIVNVGVVDKDNGKTAIYFDGVSHSMGGNGFAAVSPNASSIYLVARPMDFATGYNQAPVVYVSEGDAFQNNFSPVLYFGNSLAGNYVRFYWNSGYKVDTDISANTGRLFSTIISGSTTATVYKNGTSVATATSAPNGWTTTGTYSATFGNASSTYRRSYTHEFILYSTTNANRTAIETNINSYYAIY